MCVIYVNSELMCIIYRNSAHPFSFKCGTKGGTMAPAVKDYGSEMIPQEYKIKIDDDIIIIIIIIIIR